jgi:endonuclease/exonuclease/phosphatase family metal-dependent hydrolase
MPASRLLFFGFLMATVLTSVSMAQQVFINELHYENTGTDVDEGIEIIGAANTDLSDFRIVLYNGGAVGNTIALSGRIDDEGSGAGALWFPIAGLQNGPMDGMVLQQISSGSIIQLLAYEGAVLASNGIAAGQTLSDIGVSEPISTPTGRSLQLTGSGSSLSAFTWSGPTVASRGTINAGQTFTASPVALITLTGNTRVFAEGEIISLTVALSPLPTAPRLLSIQLGKPGLAATAASITIPPSGSSALTVTLTNDGLANGYQETTLAVTDPQAAYPTATTTLSIADASRPALAGPGSLRVMSANVLFGVGPPGSIEFQAVLELIERISPDVVVMQEVASAQNFADLKALLARAGFPQDPQFLAKEDDAFIGQPHARGELSGSADQALAIASRFPFKKRVQLGRGVSGRTEVARWPLLGVIDVPWLNDADDPVVLTVHMKADFGEANDYRRAVEAKRLRDLLANEGISGLTGNVIVAGDFNATDWFPQAASYPSNPPAALQPGVAAFADGTLLPQSFVAGMDLLAGGGFTLPYSVFPHSGLNPAGLNAMSARHADGIDQRTFSLASYKLDYIFVSQPIFARSGPAAEIYDSRKEASEDGQPKRAMLPSPSLSATASDHYALFADIPLQSLPTLALSFNRPWIWEGATDLTATITVTPPPALPMVVQLEAWRDGRVALPPTVLIPAGQSSVVVPVAVPYFDGVQPHRRVGIAARASDHRSANAVISVRNREASGQLIITQYFDPPAGSTPRAMEIMNVSGQSIDFSQRRLELRRFSNGDSTGVTDAEATSGTLPNGSVIVIGDASTGDFLVTQGLLPTPAIPFANVLDPTVYSNASGSAVFLLDSLNYNGNDALEVLLNGIRCDVFGEIGHDPGTAWSGPGSETTKGRALTLAPHISTPSQGWRQPGRRFSMATNGLIHFGVAPSITDPYAAWADASGLTDLMRAPSADPDDDGSENLLEYGLLKSPSDALSRPSLEVAANPPSFRRSLRTSDPTLQFTMQWSVDLSTWNPALGIDQVIAGEMHFTPTATMEPRRFFRQVMTRP